MVAPASGQERKPAPVEEHGGEGTTPGPPSLVRKKWCEPGEKGCFTREQMERVLEAGRSEARCRKDLDLCRGKHQVNSETWSTGTVILIAATALVAGVLVGGGVVLLTKK